jgi:hypothetical protein
MPNIADYVVIRDTKFTVSSQSGGDRDKDFDFGLESGASLNSRSILAFVLSVHKGCAFEVLVNKKKQLDYSFPGPTIVGLHEAVNGGVLNAGSNNNIEFRITAGNGTLEFKGVVLHYQRSI